MEFHHRVVYHPHSFYYVNFHGLGPLPPPPSPLNPSAPPFLPAPPPPMAAFLPPRFGVRCYRPFRLGKKVGAKGGAAAAAYGGGRPIRGFVPPRLMSKPKEEEERPKRWSENKLMWIPKDFVKPRPDTKTGSGNLAVDVGDDVAADDDQDGGDEASGLFGRTTVMIRNIPNLIKRQDLIGMLDEHCRKANASGLQPRSEYDFVYLPIDYERKMNKGYAFVNFTSSEAAIRMWRAFDRLKWEGFQWRNLRFSSKKVCLICAATIQGKAKLEISFRRRSFPSEEYQPVIAADIPRDGANGAALTLVGNRASTYEAPRSEKDMWEVS